MSLLFFEFSVLSVNALQLHVNDADVLVRQGVLGRARDNRLIVNRRHGPGRDGSERGP